MSSRDHFDRVKEQLRKVNLVVEDMQSFMELTIPPHQPYEAALSLSRAESELEIAWYWLTKARASLLPEGTKQ